MRLWKQMCEAEENAHNAVATAAVFGLPFEDRLASKEASPDV